MTPRELSGWVPAERHEHYDPDDNLTGYTVVIREPRLDDADLGDLLGLTQYQREVCACGYHISVATDKSNFFAPETTKCPVCAGEAQFSRALRKQDETHAERHKSDAPMAPRPEDGRRAFMRLLTPEQVEAEREKRAASPVRSESRPRRP